MEDIQGILGKYLLGINTLSSSDTYDGIKFALMYPQLLQMFSYYDNSLDHKDDLLSYQYQNYGKVVPQGLNWISTDVHGAYWVSAYKNIGLMNRILMEVATLNKADSDLQQQIIGEAKTVRALYAFKLLQYFAPFTNETLGIPLKFDTEDIINTSETRKSQTEVYEMILKDLKEVLAYTAPTKEDYNLYYRKNIINGILARLYQYKATGSVKSEDDWENSRMHAMAAMEGKHLASSSDELKNGILFDQ